MTYSYTFSNDQIVTWSGARACLCHTCRELFNSPSAFDKHRRDGKCLKPQTRGMAKNRRGYWVKQLRETVEPRFVAITIDREAPLAGATGL